MAKIVYVVVTVLESLLAVFGIRAPFETAPYTVVRMLSDGVELRSYAHRVAVETPAGVPAFQRLFAYIAGANVRDQNVAMTTPVEQRGDAAGMRAGAATTPLMRFFLPDSVAADPPAPRDTRVKVVDVPARMLAAIRFSGPLDRTSIERQAARLDSVLDRAGVIRAGAPYVLGYDPPFTIPFLRRNEVAVDILTAAGG